MKIHYRKMHFWRNLFKKEALTLKIPKGNTEAFDAIKILLEEGEENIEL